MKTAEKYREIREYYSESCNHKPYQLFGDGINGIIEELNEVLVA